MNQFAATTQYPAAKSMGGPFPFGRRREFQVHVPRSCQLLVTIRARGYCSFWGYEEVTASFLIRSQEERPRVQMKLGPGRTVKGIVHDAETGVPIAGAKVRPCVFAAPLIVSDSRRWATTDRLGKFELLGVMPGSDKVRIEHPRYGETDVPFPEEPEGTAAEVTLDVQLGPVPGGRVSGRVVDAVGTPLPGVEVTAGHLALTESDGQGRFVLDHAEGATPMRLFALIARKKGFFKVNRQFLGEGADDLVLTLRPLPKWSGQVLSPEGSPVKKFRVQAAPLNDARVKQVIVRDCADPQGQLTLEFEQAGRHWLAVQAEGCAAWEKTVEVGEQPESLAVRLERGVTVAGRVCGPLRKPREVQVVLTPDKEQDEPSSGIFFISTAEAVDQAMRRVACRKATLDNDGKFRIDHVRPGLYGLRVSGPDITAGKFWVAVSANDVDVGLLKVRGTGRLVGQVTQPSDETGHPPWPFVRGAITSPGVPGRVEFITDEDGRFTVEEAPVGRVTVGISYMATADMGASHSREVQVVEGRETRVWFAPPPGTPDVPLEFVVGDGSERHRLAGLGLRESRPANKEDSSYGEDTHVNIELLPPEGTAAAIPSTPTCLLERPGVTPCTIRGVPKGRYRLQVAAWLNAYSNSNEPLFERDLDVTDATTHAPPIRIRLNPAALIGTIAPADAETSVYVVSEKPKQLLQFEDLFGDAWAFRFLADGRYTVLARDSKRGWARADNLTVAAGKITDAGPLRLSPGGNIQCRITLPPGHGVPGDVVATDVRGIEVNAFSPKGNLSIPNLWPGLWTVKLFDRNADRVLATGTATIVATETVACDLAVHP
ncbi:MAG: carboxypeptidase regulatory-like domain-containing protein [Planctomycetota bacterium]|nr:carboxypeptidase regulatory-like domain-containing protein [Planctomycetota bacterium]